MSAITILPSISRAPGTYNIASVAVPLNVSKAVLALDRTLWLDPIAKVSMTMEISFDGGTNWQLLGGFTAEGGVVTNPQGVTETQSSIAANIPQPSNTNRRVRASLVITGAAFTTSSTLTLT